MMLLKRTCASSQSWRCYSSLKSQIINLQNETPSNKEKVLTRCSSIANLNKYNAFIHLFPQGNNNDNKNIEHVSMLHNVPYALKDAFTTCAITGNEAPTTMASRMLNNFYSSYDSFVYDTLSNKCHAQCLGKTNLDEFGMGGGTTYSIFGATRNPWNSEYIAGGSSGGSAASVAEGSALFSIGTDTGGSVRQPASYCGIIGFKPGYGRISRFGMISFASSLDTAGIFSKYVYDSVLVYDELIKYGQPLKENTFSNDNSAQYTNNTEPLAPKLQNFNIEAKCKHLRVGIPVEYLIDELQPEILDMWQLTMDKLKQAGATVEYISLPHTKYALPTYYIIAPAEASSNLSRYDGIRYGYNYKKDDLLQEESQSTDSEDLYAINRTNGFGEEVKRRILAGTFALSMDKYEIFFKRAQQTRTLVAKDFHETLKFNADEEEDHKYDIILTPTAPTSSIKLADYSKLNPVDIYTNDIFTIPASLAGLPAASIPSAISQKNGMPLGLQVIGATEWNTIRGAFILEHLCEFKHLNE